MRNRWFIQGLITNWVSGAIITGGARVLTLAYSQVATVGPLALYFLGAAILLSILLLTGRIIVGVRVTGVKDGIRSWLDKAGASTTSINDAKFMFHCDVAFNEKSQH